MSFIQGFNFWNKEKGHQKGPYHEIYERYKKGIQNIDPNTSMEALDFMIIDGESTGLDLQKDELISIALLPVSNNTIDIGTSYVSTISNTGITSASEIHGLLHTTSATNTIDVLSAIYNMIGNKIIVGHYIAFDIQMIEKLGLPFGFGKIHNAILDTATLAKRLDFSIKPDYINQDHYTLDHLCDRFNILTKARHTAEGDTFITALLLLKILHLLKDKGISNWKQLKKSAY